MHEMCSPKYAVYATSFSRLSSLTAQQRVAPIALATLIVAAPSEDGCSHLCMPTAHSQWHLAQQHKADMLALAA